MEIGPRLHTVRAPGHGPLPRLRVFGEPNSVFRFEKENTQCASCHLVLRVTNYYDDFHDVRVPFAPFRPWLS